MRLRTVSSIILPSAHKVKASARNSVTTVVGGGERCSPCGTGSTCRCEKLNGGGLPPRGTCYPCPGGEDHLKRRRRLRRIVPSPPVPLSLAAGTVHQCRVLTATPPPGAANAEGKPSCGHLLGRLCKCRKRSNAGVPGAKPLASPRLNPRGTGEWGRTTRPAPLH